MIPHYMLGEGLIFITLINKGGGGGVGDGIVELRWTRSCSYFSEQLFCVLKIVK